MNFFKDFITPLIISYFLFKLIIPKLKLFIEDIPNKRSSHMKPKPTSGGIIFATVHTLFNLINSDFYSLTAFPLAFFGFLDDKYHLKAIIRYVVQLIVCGVVVLQLNLNFSLLITLIIIIFGTSIINFTNFMDGIDGLVCGSMLILFLTLASLNIVNVIPLIASLFIFIFWNWSPSKIFMGDSGSTYLGGIFFTSILQIKEFDNFLGMLIVSSPLYADAFFCVIRRFISGRNIFSPHRNHLYQRLQKAGYSHSKVSLIYISCISILALFFLYGGLRYTLFPLVIEVVFLCYIDKKFAINFESN